MKKEYFEESETEVIVNKNTGEIRSKLVKINLEPVDFMQVCAKAYYDGFMNIPGNIASKVLACCMLCAKNNRVSGIGNVFEIGDMFRQYVARITGSDMRIDVLRKHLKTLEKSGMIHNLSKNTYSLDPLIAFDGNAKEKQELIITSSFK